MGYLAQDDFSGTDMEELTTMFGSIGNLVLTSQTASGETLENHYWYGKLIESRTKDGDSMLFDWAHQKGEVTFADGKTATLNFGADGFYGTSDDTLSYQDTLGNIFMYDRLGRLAGLTDQTHQTQTAFDFSKDGEVQIYTV